MASVVDGVLSVDCEGWMPIAVPELIDCVLLEIVEDGDVCAL